jgi:hypothetical protein
VVFGPPTFHLSLFFISSYCTKSLCLRFSLQPRFTCPKILAVILPTSVHMCSCLVLRAHMSVPCPLYACIRVLSYAHILVCLYPAFVRMYPCPVLRANVSVLCPRASVLVSCPRCTSLRSLSTCKWSCPVLDAYVSVPRPCPCPVLRVQYYAHVCPCPMLRLRMGGTPSFPVYVWYKLLFTSHLTRRRHSFFASSRPFS